MDEYINKIIEILKKDNLNEREKNILKDLIYNPESYKKFGKSLARVWDLSNRYSEEFNYDKVLSNIHRKINEGGEVYKYNKNKVIIPIIRYAAVFLIGFFHGF